MHSHFDKHRMMGVQYGGCCGHCSQSGTGDCFRCFSLTTNTFIFLMLMSPGSHLQHKHKKKERVPFSYAYVYVTPVHTYFFLCLCLYLCLCRTCTPALRSLWLHGMCSMAFILYTCCHFYCCYSKSCLLIVICFAMNRNK